MNCLKNKIEESINKVIQDQINEEMSELEYRGHYSNEECLKLIKMVEMLTPNEVTYTIIRLLEVIDSYNESLEDLKDRFGSVTSTIEDTNGNILDLIDTLETLTIDLKNENYELENIANEYN